VSLTLQSNALTGDVPPSLAALTHLEMLDLSENWLSGTLPELGQAPLRYLYVNNNQFTGALIVCVSNQFAGAHAQALDRRGADAEQASLCGWVGLAAGKGDNSVPAALCRLQPSALREGQTAAVAAMARSADVLTDENDG
jgi:hypothetical protein